MRVVAIGGGTGLSTLLRGLKNEVGKSIKDLSAIVTVADSGGSTGRLREIYDIPAPGDIRNCIVALSDSEDIMRELFQYRFRGDGLQGHAFGNLFLTALSEITGSFLHAVQFTSKILRTRGNIIPSSEESVHIVARFSDGEVIEGEENITKYGCDSGSRVEDIWIEPADAKPPAEVLHVLREADMIIFGPGSLFTSIIPNLLIDEIRDAVNSSQALKLYVVNAMTQPGETDDFSALDHVRALMRFGGIKNIDSVVVNTKTPPPELLERYISKGQKPVDPVLEELSETGIKVYHEDLIGDQDNYVRHNPDLLSELIVKIAHNEILSQI